MLFGLLLVVLGLGLALGLRLALEACIKFDLHYPRTHKDTRGFTRIHENTGGHTKTNKRAQRRQTIAVYLRSKGFYGTINIFTME